MLRSVLLKFVLVFALLFAQQGALSHGIAHATAKQSQGKSLPHDTHCDLCGVYAQIGSAIGSGTVDFDFASDFVANHSSLSHSCHSIAFAAFAARAPPLSA